MAAVPKVERLSAILGSSVSPRLTASVEERMKMALPRQSSDECGFRSGRQFDCGDRLDASSLHVGPLQKCHLEQMPITYVTGIAVVFHTSNRCNFDDVCCRPSSYILPVKPYLDPSLVSPADQSM